MKKIAVVVAAGFGSLLFAAPAFAGASVTANPAAAKVGDIVTITPTCTDETSLFQSISSIPALPGLVADLAGPQMVTMTTPGLFVVTVACAGVEGNPVERASVTITVAPKGPPQTGGGAESTGNTTGGIIALSAAGVIGAGLLIARRRRPNQ